MPKSGTKTGSLRSISVDVLAGVKRRRIRGSPGVWQDSCSPSAPVFAAQDPSLFLKGYGPIPADRLQPSSCGEMLMTDVMFQDMAALDQPALLAALFHPRPSFPPAVPALAQDLDIPVAEGVVLGARWHPARAEAATLLCFHGNGELAEDYDDLGAVYVQRGLQFLVVDYRGYGHSTGHPTVTTMLADSRVILDFVTAWRHQHGQTGPLIVLGRSLGSAPALELAYRRPETIAGLILDSAFAHTGPLLRRLGVPGGSFDETQGFRQLDKIRTFAKPTLILHAEHDHLIPFSDGRALYDASPARDKRLVQIRGADHNTIFAVGWRPYLEAVQQFTDPARFQSLA